MRGIPGLSERARPGVAFDVTDAAATKAVIQEAIQRFARLDVVFANAGISWRRGASTIASCDEAEFKKIVEVDLLGVWRTIRAALPEIIRNKGRVLVTSSAYAFLNGMANAPYAASKAGVEMLTRRLRAEFVYGDGSAQPLRWSPALAGNYPEGRSDDLYEKCRPGGVDALQLLIRWNPDLPSNYSHRQKSPSIIEPQQSANAFRPCT